MSGIGFPMMISFYILLQDFFKTAIDEMAARSLRCVAIAYRSCEMEKVPDDESLDQWVLPEDGLILLAIVGIKVYFMNLFSHYTKIFWFWPPINWNE